MKSSIPTALINGLLAAKVTPEDAAQLLSVLSDAVPVSLIIDLPAQTISAAGGLTVPFTVAERHKMMLLEGLDMLEATMKDKAAIEAFRREHEAAYPWMAGLPRQSPAAARINTADLSSKKQTARKENASGPSVFIYLSDDYAAR